jgi:hypothetical protein
VKRHSVVQSLGIVYNRYPTKEKAKKVAAQLRSGKLSPPRSIYAPRGLYANIGPAPDGAWNVYFRIRQR